MEAINESGKLVARSLDLLKAFRLDEDYNSIDIAIDLLEEALEKLAGKM